MYEHHSSCTDSLVDEATGYRHVDEQIGIVDVLDADAEMADARSRVVGRDWLGTNGHDMRDTPICERPRRNGSVDTGGKGGSSIREAVNGKQCLSTYVPK